MTVGRKSNNSKTQSLWNLHPSVGFLCLFASMFPFDYSAKEPDSSVHGNIIDKETLSF